MKLLFVSHLFILQVIWTSAREANPAAAVAGDEPGVRAIRMLDKEERGIIQQAYNTRKPNRALKNNYYIDLFVWGRTACGIKSTTGKDIEDACDVNVTARYEDLDQLVHNIAGDHIEQAYGFIVAPGYSKLYQHFHIDYSNTTATYWIPLVDLTSRNRPQYIPNFVGDPTNGEEDFGLEFTLMANQGLLGMVVSLTICRAFRLLYMAPGTAHHGIPNGKNLDRPIFFIEMDDKRRRIDDDEVDDWEDFSDHTSTSA